MNIQAEMRKINKVNIIHNLNHELDENSVLLIKINNGDYRNYGNADKVNLEGISLCLTEQRIEKDINGKSIVVPYTYSFGFLSNENFGDPLAYFDINHESYDFKKNLENNAFDTAKEDAYRKNISFLKEYEEIELLMAEFNKYFFEKDLSKEKIKEKIDYLNSFQGIAVQKEYNDLLKRVSSFYNSFITEETSLDREQRALEILSNPNFQEGLETLVNNFNIEIAQNKVKERNTVRDVFSKKQETFEDIINTLEGYLDIREDYSDKDKIHYVSKKDRKENSKKMEVWRKELKEIKELHSLLSDYQNSILNGTFSNENSKDYTEILEKLETKLDSCLYDFVFFNGTYPMSEPVATMIGQVHYEVVVGKKATSYEGIKRKEYESYMYLHNASIELKDKFKTFIRDYKGIDPIKTSEQIRYEESKMTKAYDELKVSKDDYVNNLAKNIYYGVQSIENLSKEPSNIDDLIVLAKGLKQDADKGAEFLYRLNVQSGTFELLRHLAPAEKIIFAEIVGQNRKGFNTSFIFENQQQFIDSYLKYYNEFVELTKNTNYNKNHMDYFLFEKCESIFKDVNDNLKEVYVHIDREFTQKWADFKKLSEEEVNKLDEDAKKIYEKDCKDYDKDCKDYEKIEQLKTDIDRMYQNFLDNNETLRTSIREFIKTNSLFKEIIIKDNEDNLVISQEDISKSNFTERDKETIKNLLNLINSKDFNISKTFEVLSTFNGLDMTSLLEEKESQEKLLHDYTTKIKGIKGTLKDSKLISEEVLKIVGIEANINKLEGSLSEAEKDNYNKLNHMNRNISFVNDVFMKNLSSINSKEFDKIFDNDFFKKFYPANAEFIDVKSNLHLFFEFKKNLEKELENPNIGQLDSKRITSALAFIEKDCLAWRSDVLNTEGYQSTDIFKRNELLEYSKNLKIIIDDLEKSNDISEKEKVDKLLNISSELKLDFYEKYFKDDSKLKERIEEKSKDKELTDEDLIKLEKECKIEIFDETLKASKFNKSGEVKNNSGKFKNKFKNLLQKATSENVNDNNNEIEINSEIINNLYKEQLIYNLNTLMDENATNIIEALKYEESEKDSNLIKAEFSKLYKVMEDKKIDVEIIANVVTSLTDEDGRNYFRYFMKEEGILTPEFISTFKDKENVSRFIEECQNVDNKEISLILNKLSPLNDADLQIIERLKKGMENLSEEDKKQLLVSFEEFVALCDDKDYSYPLIKDSIQSFVKDNKGIVIAANKDDAHIDIIDGDSFIKGFVITIKDGSSELKKDIEVSHGLTICELIKDLKDNSKQPEEIRTFLEENLNNPKKSTEEEISAFMQKFSEIMKEASNKEYSFDIVIDDKLNARLKDVLSDYKKEDKLLVNLKFAEDIYIPLDKDFKNTDSLVSNYKDSLKDSIGLDSIKKEDLKMLAEKFEQLLGTSYDTSFNFQEETLNLLLDDLENQNSNTEELQNEEIIDKKELNKELQELNKNFETFEEFFNDSIKDFKNKKQCEKSFKELQRIVEELSLEDSEKIEQLGFLLDRKGFLKNNIIEASKNKENITIDKLYEEFIKKCIEDCNIQRESDTLKKVENYISKYSTYEESKYLEKIEKDLNILKNTSEESYKTVIKELNKEYKQNAQIIKIIEEISDKLEANTEEKINEKDKEQNISKGLTSEEEQIKQLQNIIKNISNDDGLDKFKTELENLGEKSQEVIDVLEKIYENDEEKKELIESIKKDLSKPQNEL